MLPLDAQNSSPNAHLSFPDGVHSAVEMVTVVEFRNTATLAATYEAQVLAAQFQVANILFSVAILKLGCDERMGALIRRTIEYEDRRDRIRYPNQLASL